MVQLLFGLLESFIFLNAKPVSNQLTKILVVAGGVFAVFTIVAVILGIDVVRWVTCNSPFAAPQDRNSPVCRRLNAAP